MALKCVVVKKIKNLADMLPSDTTYNNMANIIKTVETKFINKSRASRSILRQEINKIKFRRGLKFGEYIDNHRHLRSDVIEAYIPEDR